MIVPLPLFAQLAGICGPAVHVDTLAAIARAESSFHSGAINDNSSGRRYFPKTRSEAVALATALIAKRHSLDLGLMQVNSTNLRRLKLSVADAFDPCSNIAAGARILVGFYQPPAGRADPQPSLLRALSGYNTGSHVRGFRNGYVAKVQAAAAQVVPAIRVGGGGPVASSAQPEAAEALPLPAAPPEPDPPSWDVYAQASSARERRSAAAGTSAPVVLQVISGEPRHGR